MMKSEVLLFPVLLLLIQNVHGFLLDGPTNGGKQTTANSQFLTETEFLQAKNLLKQNTDDLRHDMDKTFALMTSQLKSKFDLVETKLAEVDKRNETNNDCVSMEKYIALEQKLTIVEQKLTNVQRENDQIKQKNTIVENELLSLKNNSTKQDTKIEELQNLGAIKPLQEFSALRQSVHLNTDKIHSLSMNEQARSQDFLALYNRTTATGKKVTEMETNMNNVILQLKHNQTMTMNDMKQSLDNQLTSFQTIYNSTVKDLETTKIYPLRQSVQLNTDKIHSLTMNEQARSQDFFRSI
ncbi:unnamed protein product [Mytilus coruscus]|uniref:Uncharacterized protein n=1 Tax=Mytilus coruscus TaxID=42192 RepID=A0A6J8DH32_MYTCO|nr:unnamed protein product [Mytilus coruscus]